MSGRSGNSRMRHGHVGMPAANKEGDPARQRKTVAARNVPSISGRVRPIKTVIRPGEKNGHDKKAARPYAKNHIDKASITHPTPKNISKNHTGSRKSPPHS